MNNHKTRYPVAWWATLLFVIGITSSLIMLFKGMTTLVSPKPHNEIIVDLKLCNSAMVPFPNATVEKDTSGVFLCGKLINDQPISPVIIWYRESEIIYYQNATVINVGDFRLPLDSDYLSSPGKHRVDISLHRDVIGSFSYQVLINE